MTSSSTRLATDSGGAVSFDVRTGEAQGLVSDSEAGAVTQVLDRAAAAAGAMASADTRARQGWLQALAAAVEGHADELVALADRESGLGARAGWARPG